MFTPSRLTLARLRLGLTRPKLAAASEVSLRSITDFENNVRPPSDESLQKLAQALQVPLTFFERDDIEVIAATAASFRKLSKATVRRRDAVLASAALALEFFSEVDARFRLPDPSIPTYDKFAPPQAAEMVRRDWNLGDRPISNMIHLLESKGVRVAALKQEYEDIDAFCFYRDGIPYMFLNTGKTGERQRFDTAHELGHLILHGDLEMEPSTSKEREAEANAFASAFLMPALAVHAQAMGSASVDRILAARSFWKVSAMAMTHRLHELDLLSDWQYRSTCITLSERGYRKTELDGIVPETSQLLRKVMYGREARFSVKDAESSINLPANEIREFVRHLVPMST